VGYAEASSSASDGALVEEIARVHSVDCERTLGAVRRIGRLRAVDRVDRVGRIGALDRSFGSLGSILSSAALLVPAR
jgi:hypothetical protein